MFGAKRGTVRRPRWVALLSRMSSPSQPTVYLGTQLMSHASDAVERECKLSWQTGALAERPFGRLAPGTGARRAAPTRESDEPPGYRQGAKRRRRNHDANESTLAATQTTETPTPGNRSAAAAVFFWPPACLSGRIVVAGDLTLSSSNLHCCSRHGDSDGDRDSDGNISHRSQAYP